MAFGFYPLIPKLIKAKIPIDESLRLYVPPEAVDPDRAIDGRADIYSLAMILFHVMSGHLPFYGNDFLTVRDHRLFVSAAENLFCKTLAKNPDDRFDNFKDFIKELKSANQQIFGPTDVIEVVEKEQALSLNSNESDFCDELPAAQSVMHKIPKFLNWIL